MIDVAPGRGRLYEGLTELPAFNPDDDRDPLPTPVATLRGALEACSTVVFCTPECAGALPGSFKNLLDDLLAADVATSSVRSRRPQQAPPATETAKEGRPRHIARPADGPWIGHVLRSMA